MRAGEQISVVIPCYNQGRFLAEAIDSVRAQSYPAVEIIVVDDGSTDETAQVAGGYPEVVYRRQERGGLAAARNRGLAASCGDFLVFLDADDRLLPAALEVGLRSFAAHPESAFVAGHVKLIRVDGSPLASPPRPHFEDDFYLELLRHNFIWTTGAVMYRRSVFDAVPAFDTSVDGSADFDLNIRIACRLPVYWHNEDVLEYRKHPANMSRQAALMLKASITVRRSHWPSVRGNKRYEDALKQGIQSVQTGYGEKAIQEVSARLQEHEWRQACASALVLLRYYPRGFVAHALQKLYRRAFPLRRAV